MELSSPLRQSDGINPPNDGRLRGASLRGECYRPPFRCLCGLPHVQVRQHDCGVIPRAGIAPYGLLLTSIKITCEMVTANQNLGAP